jgi:hypothetical protein
MWGENPPQPLCLSLVRASILYRPNKWFALNCSVYLTLQPYFCWHPCCYWQPLFAGTLKASPLLPVSLLLLESLSVAGTSLFLVPPSWHTGCCWSPLCAIAAIPIFSKYRNRLVFYLICHYFWYCTVQSEYRIMDHKNHHRISDWSISLWNQWILDCNWLIAQLC